MASQGVTQRSIYILLSEANAWNQMESFLQLWTLPGVVGKKIKLHDLFTAKRIKFYKDNKRFKCTASECLGLTTLIKYMAQALFLPAGVQVDQCHSFVDMAAALEMLQATAQGKVSPATLQLPSCTSLHIFACFHVFSLNKCFLWGIQGLEFKG